MTTLLVTHQACFGHDPGRLHPESPARLKAILAALEAPEFAALERRAAPLAEVEQIARVHARLYVDRVLDAMPATGDVGFDPDTIASPGSGEAALRAAGAVIAAVDAVVAGEAATPSARCARPAIMPRPTGRWASACSTTSRSAPRMPARRTGWRASRWSISTSITATARSTCSSTTPTCSTPRPTNGRSIPAPGPRGETRRRQHRQRAAAARCRRRANSAPRSTEIVLPALDGVSRRS